MVKSYFEKAVDLLCKHEGLLEKEASERVRKIANEMGEFDHDLTKDQTEELAYQEVQKKFQQNLV